MKCEKRGGEVCGVGFCLLTEVFISARVSLTESSLKTLFRG